jgi:acetate kinase
MIILVLNCGSSSIKFQVINAEQKLVLYKGNRTLINNDSEPVINNILFECQTYNIDGVGHRVVHGGLDFSDAALITPDVITAIENNAPLAPLHNPKNLLGILLAQNVYPNIPHVAVFDTAFHHTLPKRAYTYAIDSHQIDDAAIRRYGFHGMSHHYVSLKAAEYLQQNKNQLRMISLHLGNGASACAIEYGHSTDTSMGMTPLEGLVMGTRSGDIDPGVIFYLARTHNLSLDEVEDLLNKHSGLKGLSQDTHDLRAIELSASEGNTNAQRAINVFSHRARKYIGAYAANMGGVDVIILTAGIGENSSSMRQRILQRLEFLGVALDDEKNLSAQLDDHNTVIDLSAEHSRVKILLIKTNEELMIAQQSAQAIIQSKKTITANTIPIAVSARHLHLDQNTFEVLFGKGNSPTKLKDISQPGQYACHETVNLIGPKGRIDKVRLLGPLRKNNQIEISRTDEFKLGVDAPIRDSGSTAHSAPITIEGPCDSITLTEGLICARRHIHMTELDAEQFNLNDKDEVEIAITGGQRDLIFGDVLVRVSNKYKLEMHIDTDEANAAELPRNFDGQLIYTSLDNISAHLRKKNTSN